jgi:hypothetical protein
MLDVVIPFKLWKYLFNFKKIYEFSIFDYHFLMKGNLVFVQGRGLFSISFRNFDKPTIDLLVS